MRIKNCRNLKNLTQKELGDRLGVSAQVISNIERGYTTGIGPNEIKNIAIILETTPDYLIMGDVVKSKRHSELTSEESVFIDCYRRAASDDKQVIRLLLQKYKKDSEFGSARAT